MAKFRSRPREIEAVQVVPAQSDADIPSGVCYCEGRNFHVHTMHDNQVVMLEMYDWIVPEPDGVHYYPIKPDVMEKNYEPV